MTKSKKNKISEIQEELESWSPDEDKTQLETVREIAFDPTAGEVSPHASPFHRPSLDDEDLDDDGLDLDSEDSDEIPDFDFKVDYETLEKEAEALEAAGENDDTESEETIELSEQAESEDEPRTDEPTEFSDIDIAEAQSCIETLLFVSDRAVSKKKLYELFQEEFSKNLIDQGISALQARYDEPSSGIFLAEVAGGFQLRTKPGRADIAKKLAKTQTQRLSKGAMETLAIIAYKQPVMKDDIDKIRGVDSSHFVRMLLDRKLVDISGRSELPGRPMLYTTSQEFLSVFGLNSNKDLPSLREIEQMIPSSEAMKENEESKKLTQLRNLVGSMKSAKDHDGYDPAADEEILQKLRDEVKAIKTSTTFLDSQKAIEKELAAAKAEGREPNLEGLETSENLNVMDVALKQAMEKAGFVENSDQSLDTPEEDSVENEEFTNDLQTLFDSPEEAQSMGAAAVSPEEGPSETTEGLEAAPTSEEDAAEHVLPDEAAPQMEIDEETAQFEAIYGLTSKDEQADLEGR